MTSSVTSNNIDLLVLGNPEFQAKFSLEKDPLNSMIPVQHPEGMQLVGPNKEFMARVFNVVLDNRTSLVIVTSTDSGDEKPDFSSFGSVDNFNVHAFSNEAPLSKFQDLVQFMKTCEARFEKVLEDNGMNPSEFAYPKEFYDVLDMTWFDQVSDEVESVEIGVLPVKTKLSEYFIVYLELHPKTENEQPVRVAGFIENTKSLQALAV